MKKPDAPSITNLIGILLVVVAIVSAGGIIYISSEYCKISEAIVYTEAQATDLVIYQYNQTNKTTITLSVLVDNPSSLDIQIYRIEFTTFADSSTSSLTDYDKYIGSGSTSETNLTVPVGSMREFPVEFNVLPGSLNMERYVYALDGTSSLWAYVEGIVWFRIANYPDVMQRIGIFYMNEVNVQYV